MKQEKQTEFDLIYTELYITYYFVAYKSKKPKYHNK